MRIIYREENRLFHLSAGGMSYAFNVTKDGRLLHLYFGGALRDDESLAPLAREMSGAREDPDGVGSVPHEQYELPTREPGDFSEPVLWPCFEDGTRGARLRYAGHAVEGERLTVRLKDAYWPLLVELHYQGFGELPLISRSLTVINEGGAPIEFQALKSAAWSLPDGESYRLTHLSGFWGAEYMVNRAPLTAARVEIQNSRLTCAAAQAAPFFALDRGDAGEAAGEVYFGVLEWSGDFSIAAEKQFGGRVTVTGGLNGFDARYILKPGERLDTPVFTGGFVPDGFEGMSRALYDWQYDFLLPKGKAHTPFPVLYNSWYPYEFMVTEQNCLSLIKKCAGLGVELFVIDDGWMKGRVNDRAGLGDWTADEARFPRGLKPVADACHERGMLFGLWVEPEMMNPDSDLYRAHPDWVLRDPHRPLSLQRNQLILNLARDDVREWAIAWLDGLIDAFGLDYLKWDMNRYAFERGWPDALKGEAQSVSLRYTRNLEAIWRHLNERHPDVLFENCASGGGRADFGMARYADRLNRSDNADPVDVMRLHEGFTMLFPPKLAGGAGNVAPETHAIHGRRTPLPFRVMMGLTGSMSIGVNLLTASEDTLSALKAGIEEYKARRADLQDAHVYRIASVSEHPYCLFEYVRRDKGAFTLFAFSHGMRRENLELPRFRMRGLLPDAVYACEDGREMTGEALMNIGLKVSLRGDYGCALLAWRRV